MKKFVSLLLVLVFSLCFATTVLAADSSNDMPDVYTADFAYIVYATASLDINQNGLAVCAASMLCTASIDRIRISSYLQRYDGGWGHRKALDTGYLFELRIIFQRAVRSERVSLQVLLLFLRICWRHRSGKYKPGRIRFLLSGQQAARRGTGVGDVSFNIALHRYKRSYEVLDAISPSPSH